MVYSISWFPTIMIMATAVVERLQNKDINPRLTATLVWTTTMSYLNGAINPFIYAYRCDNIGRDIRAFAENTKRKVFPG